MDQTQNDEIPRRFDLIKPVYRTEDFLAIKTLMIDYFKAEKKDPKTIKKTADTYFDEMAVNINNTRLLGDKKVEIKSSFLRDLFFYEAYPKFKKLSEEDQKNVGIPRSITKMQALIRFFELYFNVKQKENNNNSNNVKWIQMPDWKPKLQRHNPQGADHKQILLHAGLFKKVKCRVIAKSNYYRFGFKLLDPKTDLVGEGLIKSRNYDVLIHTGQSSQTDFSRKDLFVTLYVGLEKIIMPDKFTGIYPTNEGYECILYIDSAMTLYFFLNGKQVAQFTINKKLLSRVYMFAWADHDEFNVEIKDIFVEIQ